MGVNHAANFRPRLVNFRVDESLARYMLLALDAPAGKIDLHHFLRVQRLGRDAHAREQQTFAFCLTREPAAHVAKNIVELAVQNARAKEHVVGKLRCRILCGIFLRHDLSDPPCGFARVITIQKNA